MAHWAQLNEDNVVTNVLVTSNDEPDEGYSWLIENLGGTWVQTSYTSHGGLRINPDTNEVMGSDHFRYNYAGRDYTFDADAGTDGAFIPPYPGPGYILNTDTYLWDKVEGSGD
jgi:hypothetical protein